MTTPILKQNLVKGEKYFYFEPPTANVQVGIVGEKRKIYELEFDCITKRGAFFWNGNQGKTLESVKGLLYHTLEDAEKGKEEAIKNAYLELEILIKKEEARLRRLMKKVYDNVYAEMELI